jgi:hypothetical protein
MLGTTIGHIARLIRRGVLTTLPSNLDRRRRLIPRDEIERILAEEGRDPPARRTPPADSNRSHPLPRTFGIYDGPLSVTNDEIDERLATHWNP